MSLSDFDRGLFRLESGFCVLACAFMVAVVASEVFCRYCLGSTLMVGIDEIAKWSFVWLATMACSAQLHRRGHVAVEYFVDTFFPPGLRKAVFLATQVLLMVFFVVVIVTGFPFAFSQWHMRATSANLPKTFVYLALPVAMSCMFIHAVTQVAGSLGAGRGRAAGKEHAA